MLMATLDSLDMFIGSLLLLLLILLLLFVLYFSIINYELFMKKSLIAGRLELIMIVTCKYLISSQEYHYAGYCTWELLKLEFFWNWKPE